VSYEFGGASIGLPTRRNRRNELLAGVLRSIASCVVERSNTPPGNLAQLSAFLAASIRAGKTRASTSGCQPLLMHLKARLGVNDLTTLALGKAAVRSVSI
jgi:hypothetical protein